MGRRSSAFSQMKNTKPGWPNSGKQRKKKHIYELKKKKKKKNSVETENVYSINGSGGYSISQQQQIHSIELWRVST